MILSILVVVFVPVRAAADGEASAQAPSVSPRSAPTEKTARSALGDRRLFFTGQQRLDALHQTDSRPGSVKRGARPQQEPLQSDYRLQQTPNALSGSPVKSPPSDTLRISFNAMVSGPRGIRLLVNGLPCFSRSHEEAETARSGLRVDCPGVSVAYPDVTLLLIDERLHVLQERSALRILAPGQGL